VGCVSCFQSRTTQDWRGKKIVKGACESCSQSSPSCLSSFSFDSGEHCACPPPADLCKLVSNAPVREIDQGSDIVVTFASKRSLVARLAILRASEASSYKLNKSRERWGTGK
jgi:hypothetical protein